MGFTTHGKPIRRQASVNSSRLSAKANSEVLIPRSLDTNFLIPSLSIVNFAALAVGVTLYPSASNCNRVSVEIASISGTIWLGFSVSMISRRAWPSCIGIV